MPYGLKPNQLAWGGNTTMRGGGVRSRTGFKPLVQGAKWSGLYQGGYRYEPDFAFPYLILQIGGRIYQVRVDTDNSVHDLSSQGPGLTQPVNIDQAFMRQGEIFLVMQSGDIFTNPNPTKPLFWDGTTLTRSRGFIGVANPQNQIPPAGPMDYYQDRLWYAIGRKYIAGDIVGGPSGSAPFQKRDSILNVTENPVANAGDFFTVPTNAGNIRALWHSAELDTALGQGQLLSGTSRSIYRLNVPVTRNDWTATTVNNTPFQTVVQIRYGPVGDRSVVEVNGDTFYQTSEPAIRSLIYAVRYFKQWGNNPISRNENRVLAFNDRSLLRFSSGIEFDNRLLMTALPYQTPLGVAHRGLLPLDFDLLSEIVESEQPAWEGMLEGIPILQLFEGDFGGLQRAFAVVVSDLSDLIEVWEITNSDRFDKMGMNPAQPNDGNRINWFIETPSYTWGDPFKLKELETMELWFDKIFGTVDIRVQYRPDQWPCWIDWHEFTECTAKSCEEDLDSVSCPAYPGQPFCEDFRATKTLPKPKPLCIKSSKRPSTQFYQCQFRINVRGWMRLRGLLAYALPREQPPFQGLACP